MSIREINALIRYLFKVDPAGLDTLTWCLRANEAEWILKRFYPDLVDNK